MVSTVTARWELETKLKALPQADGCWTVPKTSEMCRKEHTPLLFGTQHSRAHHASWDTAAPACPAWDYGQKQPSLPKQPRFLTPAVVHAEKQLPRPAGCQSAARVPPPTRPREVPVPGQARAPGSPCHQRTFTPCYWSKEGALGLGEKKNGKKPRGQKTKRWHRETRRSGEDWLLSPRNSFKKMPQLVYADPLWVLLDPHQSVWHPP